MTAGSGPQVNEARTSRPGAGVSRACRAIDRINIWMGQGWGFSVVLVTAAVIYEVVARTVFGMPTQWSSESIVYVSAVAYLMGGGYAHLHGRHVRIDLVHERLSPRMRLRFDLFTMVFFVLYAGTLVWVGTEMAWASFRQGETTGTPWDPIIWPVKMAIPLAGLLLLLQGVANLLRDLGWAEKDTGTE